MERSCASVTTSQTQSSTGPRRRQLSPSLKRSLYYRSQSHTLLRSWLRACAAKGAKKYSAGPPAHPPAAAHATGKAAAAAAAAEGKKAQKAGRLGHSAGEKGGAEQRGAPHTPPQARRTHRGGRGVRVNGSSSFVSRGCGLAPNFSAVCTQPAASWMHWDGRAGRATHATRSVCCGPGVRACPGPGPWGRRAWTLGPQSLDPGAAEPGPWGRRAWTLGPKSLDPGAAEPGPVGGGPGLAAWVLRVRMAATARRGAAAPRQGCVGVPRRGARAGARGGVGWGGGRPAPGGRGSALPSVCDAHGMHTNSQAAEGGQACTTACTNSQAGEGNQKHRGADT